MTDREAGELRQKTPPVAAFFRHYHSLIAWLICLSMLLMTFFHQHLTGELWILALWVGIGVNFYFACKNNEAYPLPKKLRPYIIAALVLSAVFAIVNFFVSIKPLSYGEPRIVSGQYVLDYKGTIKRTLSEQEYHSMKCVEQRFWSGHSLFFYTVTMFFHSGGNSKKVK